MTAPVDRVRRSRALAAVAVLAGAFASPCAAQLLPLSASSSALALPGSEVWRVLSWRMDAPATLRDVPLEALPEGGGFVSVSEWAPLYRARDGTRVEQARQWASFSGRAGALRLGGELWRGTSSFHGGASRWSVGSGHEPQRGGSLAAAFVRAPAGVAGSASVSPDGRVGAALGAEALLAGAWRATVIAADLPESGVLDARWDDQSVAAVGRWSERHASVVLAGVVPAGTARLEFQSLDRVPRGGDPEPDRLAPRLGWRSVRAEYTLESKRLRAGIELEHGEGRQRIELRRGGAAYAVAAGPLREDAVAVRIAPSHGRWETRAWTGLSLASVSGSLALWPFDDVAGLAGTRFAARSGLSLRHHGVSVDGAPASRRGWDAGVALWVVDPEGDAESWRGTFFGLGRDEDRRRALEFDRAALTGIRIARNQPVWGLIVRLEVAQWVPVRTWRNHGGATAASGAAGGGTSPGPRSGLRSWGGALLRLSVSR